MRHGKHFSDLLLWGGKECKKIGKEVVLDDSHTLDHYHTECSISEMSLLCPSCSGSAIYRFGFSPAGKQKYLCLLCSRQFVVNPDRIGFSIRPDCPACRGTMHVYKRTGNAVRYRCSGYPVCRTYMTERTEE